MNYAPEERNEVIRQAYIGLFQLAPLLFEKYVDFIDTYAKVEEAEREEIYKDLFQQEETAMIAQYIREKGMIQGEIRMLAKQLDARFGGIPDRVMAKIKHADSETIEKWGVRLLTAKELEEIFDV
ncbi:hypothetical protein QUF76_14915 [Desulfobacterales bacterium HSG16]|nr:hypothetical protein [Desulfobacterales bacterium HSG16]